MLGPCNQYSKPAAKPQAEASACGFATLGNSYAFRQITNYDRAGLPAGDGALHGRAASAWCRRAARQFSPDALRCVRRSPSAPRTTWAAENCGGWSAFCILLVHRNPEIASAGIRQADGRLLAQVGPHDEAWATASEERSTETHVQVPIRAGKTKWGNVELRFHARHGRRPARLVSAAVGPPHAVCHRRQLAVLRLLLAADAGPSGSFESRSQARAGCIGHAGRGSAGDRQPASGSCWPIRPWRAGSRRDADKLIGVKASTLPWVMSSTAQPLEEYPWVAAMRLERPQAGIMLGLKHRGSAAARCCWPTLHPCWGTMAATAACW